MIIILQLYITRCVNVIEIVCLCDRSVQQTDGHTDRHVHGQTDRLPEIITELWTFITIITKLLPKKLYQLLLKKFKNRQFRVPDTFY